MPTRREILGTVTAVAVVAGCLDDPTDEPVPGVTVEISVVDYVPEEVPISFELDQATTRLDHTLPRFSFGMVNRSDDELVFEDAQPGLLREVPSDPAGLAIVTDDEADRLEAAGDNDDGIDECLSIDELPARDADDWLTTLEPDEPVIEDFAFVPIAASQDGCPASDDYAFEMSYDVYEADATDENPRYTIEWGFTVRIRDE